MNHVIAEFDSKLETIEANIFQFDKQLKEIPLNSLNLFPELTALQKGKENSATVHLLYMEEHKWNCFVAELNELIDNSKYLEASNLLKQMKLNENLTERKSAIIQSAELKLKNIFLTESYVNEPDFALLILKNLGFEKEFQELFYQVKSQKILQEWEVIGNSPQSIIKIFGSLEKLHSNNENQFISSCWDFVLYKIIQTLLPSFKKLLDDEKEKESYLATIIEIYKMALKFSNLKSFENLFELFVLYQKDQPKLEERNYWNLKLENSIKDYKKLKGLDVDDSLFARIPNLINFIFNALKRSHEFTFSFNSKLVFDKLNSIFQSEIGVVADSFIKKGKNDKDIWVSLENYINAISLFEDYLKLLIAVEDKVQIYKPDINDQSIVIQVLKNNFQYGQPDFEGLKVLLKNVCLKFQRHGFNGILNQIIVDMNGYFKTLEAEVVPNKILKFSLSPSSVIIKIGEEMLNFPQRLENFIELPGFHSKYLEILKKDDDPLSSWIYALSLMVMKEFVERIENSNFKKNCLSQLEIDLDYISNILGALQVTLIPQLDLINRSWKISLEDIKGMKVSDDCLKIKEICMEWKLIK